jgi:hypothetical protein
MKVTRFLASLLFLGFASTSAFAQGVVSVSWDNCAGPINKQIVIGPNVLNESVIGHSAPHQAYQVILALGSPGGLRDAWRFDPVGCQTSSGITINHLTKACPSFQGAFASVQVKDYSYDALSGKARLSLFNAYPPANNSEVNPLVRYGLGAITFDHSFSVVGPGSPGATCGGLEAPVCIHITSAAWLDPAGAEHPWAVGQEFVTANDVLNSSNCPGATPATPKTWGSLKNQYR